MKLFRQSNARRSPRHRQIYAAYELAYTLVDLGAALMFIVGSVMFFSEEWQISGTWCFLIGSIMFGVKPTLRFAREIHYLVMANPSYRAPRSDGRSLFDETGDE